MAENVTNMLLAEMLLARQHPPETGGIPSQIPSRTEPTRGRPFPDWYRALEEQRRQIDLLRSLERHHPPRFDLPPTDFSPLNAPATPQLPPDGSPPWLPTVPWPPHR
jgi:hypothetical protein